MRNSTSLGKSVQVFRQKERDKNTPQPPPVKFFYLIWRHNSVESFIWVKVRVILPNELTRSVRVNLYNTFIFVEEYGHAVITKTTGCGYGGLIMSALTQNGVTSRNARALGRRESQWVTGHVDFVHDTSCIFLFDRRRAQSVDGIRVVSIYGAYLLGKCVSFQPQCGRLVMGSSEFFALVLPCGKEAVSTSQ